MDARLKPIPAFYCCYLLRSTVRTSSLYVGSSPDPSRRLAQHNGKVKGGAVRTSRLTLRPWEMVCIVAGFPSNIAALQFEWAWQNAHLTRHISQDQRISFPTSRTKTNAKTGKTRRKPGRPRTSLIDKLANLHLLLRAPYFGQWPLELRFFSKDTYELWGSWCERADGQIRKSIGVVLDLPQSRLDAEEFSSAQRPAKVRKIDLIGNGGVEGVDPTYARYREVLGKSKTISEETRSQLCEVCSGKVNVEHDLFTICPRPKCRSVSHLTCLSNEFLKQARPPPLIPEHGLCPSCGDNLRWADLMRAITLRTRGEKLVRKLLSKKHRGKVAMAADLLSDSENEDSDDSVDDVDGDADEIAAVDLVDEEIDDTADAASVTSIDSFDSLPSPDPIRLTQSQSRLEIVIEDSEDER